MASKDPTDEVGSGNHLGRGTKIGTFNAVVEILPDSREGNPSDSISYSAISFYEVEFSQASKTHAHISFGTTTF